MTHPRRACRRTVLAAATFLFAIVLLPALARAEYGEVQRIGGKAVGPGNGQLTPERTRLLGVDPTENSIYVLDEPQKFTQTEEPEINPETKECNKNEVTEKCVMVGVGPLTRHFRIQKFSAEKGYAFAAAAKFDETAPEPQFYSGATFAAGVEGIAVDPELKRLYVLTADNREKGLSVDARSVKETRGQGLLAASTLYAFSTVGVKEGKEGTLVPAVGGNPVLTTPTMLATQSTTPGQALLEPSGITVDPKTHEVIVLGHVDEAGANIDDIAGAGDHYALQRIKSDGTLGARYVDKTNFFKTPITPPPDSPVVVPVGSSERVYVNYQGLAEVPYDFGAGAAHAVSVELMPPFPEGTAQGPLSSLSNPVKLWTGAVAGGVLSAAPSPDGSVYGWAEIRTEELNGGLSGDRRDGVLKLAGSDGSNLGWTGGQTPLLEPGTEVPCAAQPGLNGEATELPLRIVAGSGEKVFVLNPEFLKRKEWEGVEEPWTKEGEEEQEIESEGIESSPKPFYPAIVEFGPEGSGCPHVRATPPEARAAGEPLTEAKSVPVGSPVTFSSETVQGDVVKVEWEFVHPENEAFNEKEPPVTTDKWSKTTVTHKFRTRRPVRSQGEDLHRQPSHPDNHGQELRKGQNHRSAARAASNPRTRERAGEPVGDVHRPQHGGGHGIQMDLRRRQNRKNDQTGSKTRIHDRRDIFSETCGCQRERQRKPGGRQEHYDHRTDPTTTGRRRWWWRWRRQRQRQRRQHDTGHDASAQPIAGRRLGRGALLSREPRWHGSVGHQGRLVRPQNQLPRTELVLGYGHTEDAQRSECAGGNAQGCADARKRLVQRGRRTRQDGDTAPVGEGPRAAGAAARPARACDDRGQRLGGDAAHDTDDGDAARRESCGWTPLT